MNKHDLNIETRFIDNPIFNHDPPADLKLKDKVLIYFNGINWKIIPIDFLLKYPLVYDIITETDSEGKIVHNIPVTVSFCPLTFVSVVYEGTYTPSEYLLNNCLVIKNKTNELLPIITGMKQSNPETSDKIHVRRWEADIKLFRNALSDYPDAQYLVTSGHTNNNAPIVDNEYINNNEIMYDNITNNIASCFHPKTLVYLIEYKSQQNKNKYTIIVGKDANTKNVSGYDTAKSGLTPYLENIEGNLRDKVGFILPVFWYAWKPFYNDAKIICLDKKMIHD
ncbi:MAG: hypothetical protein Edafosvirus14_22 [Edafosvirus sp.]|uniref:Uncharacterized protein n=1 Tax=Edafosvirus sp. TaxID=2487765 RepID=A0A3G4ZUA7_9VIRU|nr:MAG: hypothetical protein Edafosvirus14_22 [Edafosvirus sp.]